MSATALTLFQAERVAKPIARPRLPATCWLAAILVVVLSSGNPVVSWATFPEAPVVATALFLTCVLILQRRVVPNVLEATVFASFIVLIGMQLVIVPGAGVVASAGFVTLLFIGYALMHLSSDMPRRIVFVISAFAALSLLVFFVQQAAWLLGYDLARLLAPLSVVQDDRGTVNVILQNFNAEDHRYRNAGIFWEPGALAGYCMLALLLLGFQATQVSRREYWTCLVLLSVTVLTTRSTTGYLVLPAILAYHVLLRHPTRLVPIGVSMARGLLAAIAAALALVALFRLEFVGDKIREQLEISLAQTETYWQVTRFGALISDLTDIAQRPLIGWGANPLTRPSIADADEFVRNNQGNGLSNFVARFGFVGTFAFIIFGTFGFRRFGKTTILRGLVALVLVLAMLFSEPFLNYPLFLALMFLPDGPDSGYRALLVPTARQPVHTGSH